VIKLEGAIYYNAEFSAPWIFHAPPSRVLAPYFSSRGGHVIIYHLLTEGKCSAGLEDGERISLTAGDVVIFPHEAGGQRERPASHPGAGPEAGTRRRGRRAHRFVCGYMSCDPQQSGALLAGDDRGRWLENSNRFSVGEADAASAGGEAVLSKLSEVLFVETFEPSNGNSKILPPASV